MFRKILLLFSLLVVLVPQAYGGKSTGPTHQNSRPPNPLSPALKNSGSAVLERMASFLDDYKNDFKNHMDCTTGKSKHSYGYLNCEETFANGIYITSSLLKTTTKQALGYSAVFYRYSGADAATQRDRLVSIINQRLPIGKTDGTWDIKFPDDDNFNGYHYYWAYAESFKLWIRLVDGELRVSATAYLTKR